MSDHSRSCHLCETLLTWLCISHSHDQVMQLRIHLQDKGEGLEDERGEECQGRRGKGRRNEREKRMRREGEG